MKCSINCKFYKADLTSNGFEVWCAIRGFAIKDIRNKFPETYMNCSKYQEIKGR
jgi:hypothetical protein